MWAILLNGPSSAGKSSIAKALQRRLPESEIIALDDFLCMTAEEPIWEDDVFAVTPNMCAAISQTFQQRKNVIIDHVITSERVFGTLLDAVKGQELQTILVTCDPAILRERERKRGNRCIGSAEASLAYLYPKDGYDFSVDSGSLDPAEAAERIAALLV